MTASGYSRKAPPTDATCCHSKPRCSIAAARAGATVQPVTLRFVNADGSISQAASYVGDTTLLQSIWLLASARPGG